MSAPGLIEHEGGDHDHQRYHDIELVDNINKLAGRLDAILQTTYGVFGDVF